MILAGRSVGVTVGLGSHAIALPPILRAGTDAQRVRWVPPVLRGERIAALAVTEPGGGSDVAALRTRARRDGDHYVVDGAKTFITSGARADLVTVAVRTGEAGHGGISMLVVEAGTPGFTVGRRLKKMGWWASDTAELFFDNCRVPAENLVGEEGAGFIAIMQNFVTERVLLAAQCVAIASLALRESAAYARERSAFGRPIAGFQVIRHKLADMTTRLAAARALTGEVVQRALRGDADPSLAAMAKNAATDMCSAVCDDAVQIHGGNGYMREYVVERLYRDARLFPIGGGTREIMNEIIARTVNGLTVTIVELAGTYHPMAMGPQKPGEGGAEKRGSMLLGAVVSPPPGRRGELWFFKLTGPKKTVEGARARFDALIDSVKVR
jgi:acyl-CoA dehydrogenase